MKDHWHIPCILPSSVYSRVSIKVFIIPTQISEFNAREPAKLDYRGETHHLPVARETV